MKAGTNIINYRYYANELIDAMSTSNDIVAFKEYAKIIGQELNRLGGSDALFKTLDFIVSKLTESDYSNEFFNYLRDIEFSWSGINDNFQA
jgi:hypothetical protein